jgi:hypothetical protein
VADPHGKNPPTPGPEAFGEVEINRGDAALYGPEPIGDNTLNWWITVISAYHAMIIFLTFQRSFFFN